MVILGIESSSDETASAVVENGATILSSVVASQIAMHAKYGGFVPELASRKHPRAIVPAVRMTLLEQSGATHLDAAAVTQGPGKHRDSPLCPPGVARWSVTASDSWRLGTE